MMSRLIGAGKVNINNRPAAWSDDARGMMIGVDPGDEPARPHTQLWSSSADTITMGLNCTIDLNIFPSLLARARYAELHRQLRGQTGGDEALRLEVERVVATHITGEWPASDWRAIWLETAAMYRRDGDLELARHCLEQARALRGQTRLP